MLVIVCLLSLTHTNSEDKVMVFYAIKTHCNLLGEVKVKPDLPKHTCKSNNKQATRLFSIFIKIDN